MPDHIHLLIEIETVQDMSAFLRDFKKYTSAEIKKLVEIREAHVWQRGTMDHCIRPSLQNEDFDNHLRYVYYNSWKHLGRKPKEFIYHNFNEMIERGWLEDDFFDFDVPEEFDKYE
jgi:REP element-mobilizing transposase RayT